MLFRYVPSRSFSALGLISWLRILRQYETGAEAFARTHGVYATRCEVWAYHLQRA